MPTFAVPFPTGCPGRRRNRVSLRAYGREAPPTRQTVVAGTNITSTVRRYKIQTLFLSFCYLNHHSLKLIAGSRFFACLHSAAGLLPLHIPAPLRNRRLRPPKRDGHRVVTGRAPHRDGACAPLREGRRRRSAAPRREVATGGQQKAPSSFPHIERRTAR